MTRLPSEAYGPPMDWTDHLLQQLTWHWDHQLRPGLAGLTDEEYFWEPVPGCWSLRRAAGGGNLVIDWERPEPKPTPVTTIAWRLAHLIVGVFGARNANHFGGPPASYQTWQYGPDAASALAQLDEAYGCWVKGVASLGPEGIVHPVGPVEGPYAESPYAGLVLHIHREVIHHGAEILLLRDLYRHQSTGGLQ